MTIDLNIRQIGFARSRQIVAADLMNDGHAGKYLLAYTSGLPEAIAEVIGYLNGSATLEDLLWTDARVALPYTCCLGAATQEVEQAISSGNVELAASIANTQVMLYYDGVRQYVKCWRCKVETTGLRCPICEDVLCHRCYGEVSFLNWGCKTCDTNCRMFIAAAMISRLWEDIEKLKKDARDISFPGRGKAFKGLLLSGGYAITWTHHKETIVSITRSAAVDSSVRTTVSIGDAIAYMEKNDLSLGRDGFLEIMKAIPLAEVEKMAISAIQSR